MVFYFSGTGNSLYVATRLAEATGESLMSIEKCMENGEFAFRLQPGERLGFVTPVYFWGLPVIVVSFVNNLRVEAPHHPFTYHVLTYGTTTGQAHHQMAALLKRRGFHLDARYNVRMVDTWTPLFNLSNRERCLKTTRRAEPRVDKAVERASGRVAGNFDRAAFPAFLARVYYHTYNRQRRTRHFHLVADRCIGCGLCARCCPAHAITMSNKRPQWMAPQCILCLRCLHQCPAFAIQYGSHTEGHGQFVNPHTKPGTLGC